jgi:hypothetical protein
MTDASPLDDDHDLTNWLQALNLPDFLSEDRADSSEWLVEPIIPAGAAVAIWARAKVGKSLLLLDVCAALASGGSVLGGTARDPLDVCYFDMENPETELRSRFYDLGYTASSDLKRLHYYHLPTLPPLDTDFGGAVLAAQVNRYRAALVVVDTTASAVNGGENDSDTYRGFYRYTGSRLRPMGCSLVRLDHGGKDRTKGQRGSSAKDDDVDVVWEMTAEGSQLLLHCTRKRVAWVPNEVRIVRHDEPLLRHELAPAALPAGTIDLAEEIDKLGLPLDVTMRAAMTALRDAGRGRRQADVLAALKYRTRPR